MSVNNAELIEKAYKDYSVWNAANIAAEEKRLQEAYEAELAAAAAAKVIADAKEEELCLLQRAAIAAAQYEIDTGLEAEYVEKVAAEAAAEDAAEANQYAVDARFEAEYAVKAAAEAAAKYAEKLAADHAAQRAAKS